MAQTKPLPTTDEQSQMTLFYKPDEEGFYTIVFSDETFKPVAKVRLKREGLEVLQAGIEHLLDDED